MSNRTDLAQEMQTVLRALERTRVLVAGLGQADTARKLTGRLAYSPLRTSLEHAEQAAARIIAHLGARGSALVDEPHIRRDGGQP